MGTCQGIVGLCEWEAMSANRQPFLYAPPGVKKAQVSMKRPNDQAGNCQSSNTQP